MSIAMGNGPDKLLAINLIKFEYIIVTSINLNPIKKRSRSMWDKQQNQKQIKILNFQ